MGFIPEPMIFPLIMLISCSFCIGRAIDCGGKNIANTITVDRHAKGAFRTVQAAIDSVSSNNNQWVKIHINIGVYLEKVQIPREKPCIILEGSDSRHTVITYSDYQETDSSATFSSYATNVVVSGISFKNAHYMRRSYKRNKINKSIVPAVAARVYGDKTFFLRCAFMSYQDTLFDVMGRHYFKDCYIRGEVDFIFGDAVSYYENCTIDCSGSSIKPAGYVTAQSRNSTNDPGGFVFKGGSLVGRGQVNLGRAWGPYSRVIFYGTYFSSIVTPVGWDAWHFGGHEGNFTYAEVECTGPGSDTSHRVPWEKKLNGSELDEYSLSSFINKDGWLDNLPPISV